MTYFQFYFILLQVTETEAAFVRGRWMNTTINSPLESFDSVNLFAARVCCCCFNEFGVLDFIWQVTFTSVPKGAKKTGKRKLVYFKF